MIRLLLALLVIVPAAAAFGAEDPALPKINLPADASGYGANIQRAMTLMATSTPTHRNKVKVLFYGQSITEQNWWKLVADNLRKRFPYADLLIENRAIGGHSSQLLVRTAEADLYPFYPDLMIFYVYGSHFDYESIIARTRQRTTADILIQTEHPTGDGNLTEEKDPAKINMQPDWSNWMSRVFLPSLVKKYGVELANQRDLMEEYLKSNNMKPGQLLRDGVHLNDAGLPVMAAGVVPYLQYLPKAPKAAWINNVKDITVGSSLQWKGNRLTLPFEGNRVDIIANSSNVDCGPVQVLIDGKKPSELDTPRAKTKTTGFAGTNWPCLLSVGNEKPLLIEDWTVTIKEISADGKKVSFSVSGSKTGLDGEGTSEAKFVSPSGRVVIEPVDWNLAFCYAVFKKDMPVGSTIKWSVYPLYQDEYQWKAPADASREESVTIVQGIPNTKHTLELISPESAHPAIRAIRVYHPPMAETK